MKVYHSSNMPVPHPDVLHSRDALDFGKGFYLTPLREQAVSYAMRFTRRNQEGWLSTYELDFEIADWKILKLDTYDSAWLEFISMCRAGNDMTDYDMVIGGIANDKVIRTLDRYFLEELSTEETLGLLKYEKPNVQYSIRSQAMLDACLKFIGSQKV